MTGWKEDGTTGGGGNKDQRVAVLKALADWWITGGGKEGGKLRYFADQPLLAHPEVTDRHLVVFAFEDFLKRWFFNLLQVLEVSQIIVHANSRPSLMIRLPSSRLRRFILHSDCYPGTQSRSRICCD